MFLIGELVLGIVLFVVAMLMVFAHIVYGNDETNSMAEVWFMVMWGAGILAVSGTGILFMMDALTRGVLG